MPAVSSSHIRRKWSLGNLLYGKFATCSHCRAGRRSPVSKPLFGMKLSDFESKRVCSCCSVHQRGPRCAAYEQLPTMSATQCTCMHGLSESTASMVLL
jgi:hypothetical protein